MELQICKHTLLLTDRIFVWSASRLSETDRDVFWRTSQDVHIPEPICWNNGLMNNDFAVSSAATLPPHGDLSCAYFLTQRFMSVVPNTSPTTSEHRWDGYFTTDNAKAIIWSSSERSWWCEQEDPWYCCQLRPFNGRWRCWNLQMLIICYSVLRSALRNRFE